ncbi:hypothetical protein CN918_30625 [Priestia megaterium]|nr:hypothetical protein CN918_30625 [Priestia megaterium]
MEATLQIDNQYELGKKLYHEWAHGEYDDPTHETIRELGNDHINIQALMRGFLEEKEANCPSDREEAIKCFYGALDDVGHQHWYLAHARYDQQLLLHTNPLNASLNRQGSR